MIYIIADKRTEAEGFAKVTLPPKENPKILTSAQGIRGLAFGSFDKVYLLTRDSEKIQTVIPALVGANVFSCKEWFCRV